MPRSRPRRTSTSAHVRDGFSLCADHADGGIGEGPPAADLVDTPLAVRWRVLASMRWQARARASWVEPPCALVRGPCRPPQQCRSSRTPDRRSQDTSRRRWRPPRMSGSRVANQNPDILTYTSRVGRACPRVQARLVGRSGGGRGVPDARLVAFRPLSLAAVRPSRHLVSGGPA